MIKLNPALSAITETNLTNEKKCEIIAWAMAKTKQPVTKGAIMGRVDKSKYCLSNSWFRTQNWLLQNQDKITKAEETELLKVVYS